MLSRGMTVDTVSKIVEEVSPWETAQIKKVGK